MTDCQSTRGKWSVPGQPPNRCPACKAPMPVDRGPLRSDKAMKSIDENRRMHAQMANPSGMAISLGKTRRAA